MRHNKLITATVVCVALTTYAALILLSGRPALGGHHADHWIFLVERFCAYGVLGLLLAFLLPGRFVVACFFVVCVAALLEVLQTLIPTRDPALFSLVQKVAGGISGVFLAQAILIFVPRPPSTE
jgi:VanZ family protein